mmetsp:Transcript_1862/g.4246  ORF Transcript_1862/g.4246 Transcript_1862/m.4246 type:complete len:253 (-) Transcript_1862:74-832(-)|eukprot:CAMPEP_0177662264 /NCGR_PEP_ID=MMETSP0447-20121125/19187_1 /TAXON_ID=0 /ORGANISM="Stygamoeba regulata, Strain BSH-02190019" /LENGTH=252 /DNA_ID=CAMNT_0019167797 /DNA_START=63 /DNA_END=821 /DNA_ORIENTATION=+
MLSATKVSFVGLAPLRLFSAARFMHATTPSSPRVAVVLSGCGVYDGSEIHETTAVLLSLSKRDAKVTCFAPDIPQMHVINHQKGEPAEGESRSVLVESARIARGPVTPLSDLSAENFDAVVFPGGFGAAKNLSSFAVEGASMSVQEDVASVLRSFRAANKPIGLCCIAPVLAAKTLAGCEVTVGAEGEVPQAIRSWGATHVPREVSEVHLDQANKLITTPAYMCGDAPIHKVFEGIDNMVAGVLDQVVVSTD